MNLPRLKLSQDSQLLPWSSEPVSTANKGPHGLAGQPSTPAPPQVPRHPATQPPTPWVLVKSGTQHVVPHTCSQVLICLQGQPSSLPASFSVTPEGLDPRALPEAQR